jgi:fatty-acid peroxygenase
MRTCPIPPSRRTSSRWWTHLDGGLLDARIAAVELLNVLRPVVAIAWYVADAAHAFVLDPSWRDRVATDPLDTQLFAQEVRRYYPFTPFVGARVRKEFEWREQTFRRGRLVLLDVYGMLHDVEEWEDPQTFRPDRLREREVGPFDFVAQGGGDAASGHRCAGEMLTVTQIEVAARFLASGVDYEVPAQDLEIPLSRIPTRPRSGVVIRPKPRRTARPRAEAPRGSSSTRTG